MRKNFRWLTHCSQHGLCTFTDREKFLTGLLTSTLITALQTVYSIKSKQPLSDIKNNDPNLLVLTVGVTFLSGLTAAILTSINSSTSCWEIPRKNNKELTAGTAALAASASYAYSHYPQFIGETMCNKIVQGANALIIMLASASMLIKYYKPRYPEQTQASFIPELTRSLSNNSETYDEEEAQTKHQQRCCFR